METRVTTLERSPGADGPVVLRHRELGEGPPVVLLHGGWGQRAYPWDAAMHALAAQGLRALAPDRSGYGGSTPLGRLAPDFHARAADETRAWLDAQGIGPALLWGHSDGAVIALHLALDEPARFPALVAEATHLWKAKPASRAFFTACAQDPSSFGPRVAAALEEDHGARWQDVVRMNGRAWLALADEARAPDEDLYGGRLRDVRADVLLLHGARDPRTEPGEWDALVRAVPGAQGVMLPDAAHAPHSERASAAEATALAVVWLAARARLLG